MYKLDKFIIKSFIGPFLLTTGLATFILLIQYMLKYFDDFVGKNLGFSVFAELLFYFSLNMMQIALPLGVLVSSLMTFGNLGEQFELTAIKSAGISLTRALRPVFFFVVILAYAAFNFNNYVVPSANLKAYSLLYDIKHKKAALNITAGVFYNEIPDYSIYAKEKYGDNKTLRDVLIYDHTDGDGNRKVIMADSSLMYTILNEKYLKLEMYNGNYFIEEEEKKKSVDQFFRSKFDRMDMVFNLSSFDLKRTKEELFENNRQMKNLSELSADIDSLEIEQRNNLQSLVLNVSPSYKYLFKDRVKSLQKKDTVSVDDEEEKRVIAQKNSGEVVAQLQETPPINQPSKLSAKNRPIVPARMALDSADKKNGKPLNLISSKSKPKNKEENKVTWDSLDWAYLDAVQKSDERDIMIFAKNNAQNIRVNLGSTYNKYYNLRRDISKYTIEKHKKFSQAVACIIMFLIGAPLGAIIKKGGLGVPVIISIFFFLSYYVISIMCAKWSNEGLMNPVMAAWLSNLVLLPFGLFFLRQARIDARLFEVDFYNIWLDKVKMRLLKR